MFLTALLASAIVAGAPQGAGPPPPPARPQEPQLEIGLHSYRANEVEAGSTSANGIEPFTSFMTASDTLCQVGGGKTEPATVAGFAWRVSGQVLSRDSDGFTVQISWQREWDHGVRLVDGPKGSSTRSAR
jgi:hypothetical protein